MKINKKVIGLLAGVMLSTVVNAQSYQQPINDSIHWQGNDKLRFRTSIYTVHYHPSNEHNNHQKLINAEYIRKNNWLFGLALFHNSFNQPSQYLYIGKDWRFWEPYPELYLRATLTAGLLHGYTGKYKNKIPFNKYGIAPAILPILAIDYKSVFIEANFFATAGMMTTIGFTYSLDK
ncbi:hypothetical protein [Suttonella ornithocola]|uniref:Sn-glycerol-3-phosphate transporter n=1 Tax=Suttonella ornithocola TaxID=279832 RepID=A0A380MS54_9GAMM|nr:hypothetical protein [Suttonella ornithocola]SUO95469.1 Uncharacterised protein [Suttonella ornithocola]